MKKIAPLYAAAVLFAPWYLGNARHPPLIFAHRGARSLAPENTCAAARAAAQIGADGWEFDVRLTKDGELILMHDETLARTTNVEDLFPLRKPWKVSDFTYAEVSELDAGSWFLEEDPFGTLRSGELPREEAMLFRGEKVPTLREALMLSLDLGLLVNIEIKSAVSPLNFSASDEIAVKQTVALVRELNMTDQVLISSFNPGIVRLAGLLAPELKVALLLDRPIKGLDKLLKELGISVLNLNHRLFSDAELCNFRKQGYEIYLWTVNDPPEIARFLSNPCVTGIITDWPQRVPQRPPR
ncbi:glycerophosphodiester phosphodiesterase [Candidatus Bipolaricaulota bacterium]|nr:glycerophosphodiester phosphodiesterase [Candidatus Bipolaricaulota bacterium]